MEIDAQLNYRRGGAARRVLLALVTSKGAFRFAVQSMRSSVKVLRGRQD